MQITARYDFANGPRLFTPEEITSFEDDVQTAINIFNATFTNNISLTFNVGFGSFQDNPMAATAGGLGNVNFGAAVFVSYSQLRTALLTFGQPGFFNAANLPAGASINGVSNFWVSSSIAAALGLPAAPNRPPGTPDGYVGINIGAFSEGSERISALLHEFGHAMGRVPDNLDPGRVQVPGNLDPAGDNRASALDLVRFVSLGNRLFNGTTPGPTGTAIQAAYFSLDGGVFATRVTDWDRLSPADFRSASKLTPDDPFNDVGRGTDLAKFTTADIQLMEALGFRVGPTAVMMLRRASDGVYEIYSLGDNANSASSQFGQVGTDWQFVTLGGFDDDFTSEMLLRNSTSGGFEVYDINHNELTGVAFMGDVGLDWQFFGVGNFSSKPGETDIMLRNTGTGQDSGKFLIYNIKNDGITDTFRSPLPVGLNCQFSGIGNFSGSPGASDMILRDTNSGKLFLYNINNNQITFAREIGTVGLNCQLSGVGNFSSNPGESDIIFRDTNTGKLFLYNIVNQITFAGEIGNVGLNWQFAGVAPIRVPGASDLVLRNVNTGEFWIYNIANNQIMGNRSLATVGLEWQLGGFAPTASNGFIGNSGGPLASQPARGSSTSQLVVLALERRLTALLHLLATMIFEGFGGLRLRGALLVVALVRYRRGRHPINPG